MTIESSISARHSLIGTSLLTAISFCASGAARAADWEGTVDTDWNTDANWSGGLAPLEEEVAVINTNPVDNDAAPFIATIFSDIPAPGDINVGFGAGLQGRLDHTAGSARTGDGNWMTIGRDDGMGVYNLADTEGSGGALTGSGQGSGSMSVPNADLIIGLGNGGDGTMNVNTSGIVDVGKEFKAGEPGATGVLNMDAGTINTGVAGQFSNTFFGRGGGSGTLNLSGGTFNAAGSLLIGADAGSTGTAVIDGGTIHTGTSENGGNPELRIGAGGGTGEMTVNGGEINSQGWNFIGVDGDAQGTLVMNGGTFNSGSETQIGWGATGEVILSGGTYSNPQQAVNIGLNGGTGTLTLNDSGSLFEAEVVRFGISFGEATGSNGTLNLQAGTLTATNFEFGQGSQVLNLNGGTLRVSRIGLGDQGSGQADVFFNGTQIVAENSADPFIDDVTTAVIEANGLNVDSNGFDLSVPQNLTGSGGVRKTGLGTLLLTSNNDFTGDNVIEAGKLAVTSFTFESGGFTVEEAATFGAIQDFPDEILEVPFIDFADPGGATLEIDLGAFLGNPSAAPLDVTGTLTLNGPVTVDVLDEEPEVGTIPLISYAAPKSGTGEFVLGSLPGRVTATLSDDGNGLVSLEVTEVAPPTTGFEDWAAANGLTAGVDDGPAQDPDFDGVPNLLEFVLGGDPLASDSTVLPQATITPDDFVFTFSRSDDSEAEVALTFEWSTSLETWNDVPLGTSSSGPDGNGVAVEIDEGDPAEADDAITVRVPRTNASGDQLFGRLRASLIEP